MKRRQFKEKPACSGRPIPYQTEVGCPHCGYGMRAGATRKEQCAGYEDR